MCTVGNCCPVAHSPLSVFWSDNGYTKSAQLFAEEPGHYWQSGSAGTVGNICSSGLPEHGSEPCGSGHPIFGMTPAPAARVIAELIKVCRRYLGADHVDPQNKDTRCPTVRLASFQVDAIVLLIGH